jgi:hypothetical protein
MGQVRARGSAIREIRSIPYFRLAVSPPLGAASQSPALRVGILYFLRNDIQRILEIKYIQQLIDAMVFDLYFPEEFKAANKEILKNLGELKPITDDMTDEEKMVIIQSEFDRLYDPGHPVRNNLDTLDSVEEVRIIKEAVA